jgi:O-antigen/teichoic acid export membrane protein
MYAPLLIVALGLMMARLLVAAHVLGVTEFARFSAALLVSSSFCMLGALGLQSMLQRALPGLILRGQERRGMVMLLQGLVATTACALIGLAAAFAVPVTDERAIDGTTVAVGMLHGLSQQAFLLVTVESRSRGATMAFGRQYLLRSLLVVGCGYGAMRVSGSGAWSASSEAVATLAIVAGIVRRIGVRSRCGMALPLSLAVRRMGAVPWRSAMALLAVFALSWAVQNVDRWAAEGTLGVAEFAGYAFAGTILSASSSLQMVTSASLFPRLAIEHARAGRRSAFSMAMRFSALLGVIGLVAFPLALLAWRLFVDSLFPQYAWTLVAAPVLFLVGIVRIADYWSGYLLVIGAERRLLGVTIASAATVGASWWMATSMASARSIESIAWLALAMAAGPGAAGLVSAWRLSRR